MRTMFVTFLLISGALFAQTDLQGTYKPTNCSRSERIQIVYNEAEAKLYAKIEGSNSMSIYFDEINKGRREFNSCWSDGLMGYSETVLKGNKVIETTVYRNAGFFCTGGAEKYRVVETLVLNKNILTHESYRRPSDGRVARCIYEKVQ